MCYSRPSTHPKNAAAVSKSDFFPCENIHIYYYVLLCEHCKKKHDLSSHMHLDEHAHVAKCFELQYQPAMVLLALFSISCNKNAHIGSFQ